MIRTGPIAVTYFQDEVTLTQADQLKKRIRGWFLSTGWTVEDGRSPDAPWVLRAAFGHGPKVIVYPKEDQLVLRCSVAFSEDQASRWALQDHSVRQAFLWDLRFRLLDARAEFEIKGEERGEIEEILLHERIFEDGLTKDRFWQRLRTVRNAALLAIFLFLYALGDPPPPTESVN